MEPKEVRWFNPLSTGGCVRSQEMDPDQATELAELINEANPKIAAAAEAVNGAFGDKFVVEIEGREAFETTFPGIEITDVGKRPKHQQRGFD